MAIDLAKLVVRLEAQSAQFLSELEKANRKLDKFEGATSRTLRKWTAGLVAAFSVKAAVGFTSEIIKAEASLGDMAQRAGASVETLSRLGYAAEQSSTSIEGLAAGFKGLSKSASEAADGNKEAIAAFKAVDVSAEDSSGNLKSTEELLLDLADGFSKYEDGLQKTAAAQKIFGKSGEELIPFLNKGRAGIEALMKKADELGITLSSKGAQAADDFNNKMNTLGAITKGIVARALTEVLPIINKLTDGLEAGATGSQKWNDAARVLAAGMKILITTGLVIGEIFDRVGTAIGQAAGALTDIAKGNFKDAYETVKAAQLDTIDSVKETARQIQDVWSTTSSSLVDDLSEVEVKVRRVFAGGEATKALEDLQKKLEAAGKAMTESVATPYEKLQATIKKADELLAAHVITLETWRRAVAAAADEVDPFLGAIARMGDGVRDLGVGIREELEKNGAGLDDEIQKAVDKINDRFDKAVEARKKQTEAIDDELKRNTQDILATGIEDAIQGGVESGAKGALEAFGKMLEHMAAQALAAKIAEKIFGTPNGNSLPTSSGGGSGWLDSIISFGAKLFGGTRDSGGRGQKGKTYMIGTGAQPEAFVPDSAGTFYPAGSWGGGGGRGVTQNIYTSSPVTQRSARQLEMEAARRQRIATARLG